jgi:predicted alpha/beta-hydrolase family hydrolase
VPLGDISLPVSVDGEPGGDIYILAPSSGGHMDDRLRRSLAATFSERGFGVVRFNFPYRVLGKSMPDRMPGLVSAYSAISASVRERLAPDRLFIGGHSMGGRVASMMAADGYACDGLILLGYPLHPAGHPEKLRDAHLASIMRPVLCLNGTRDDLCLPELMEGVLARLPETFTMHWLKGADHSFGVLKSSGRTHADVLAEIGEVSRGWAEASTKTAAKSAS